MKCSVATRASFCALVVAIAGCSGGGSGSQPVPVSTNASVTGSASAAPNATGTPTTPATPGASASPGHTASPAPSSVPSAMPTVTASPGPTASHSPSPTASPTSASPTGTPTPTPVPTSIATPAATNGPALTVDATQSRHAISPDIYGVTIFWSTTASNYAAFKTFAQAIGLPANRYGGDGTTRYNWNVDSSNAGSDFYFFAGNNESNVVPGASVDTIVDNNRALGAASIITVPIIDYINNSAAYHCSYPSNEYPNQQSYDPYVQPNNAMCGNGTSAATGQYITDTDVLAHDESNTTAIQKSWVSHFVSKYGNGGVPIYELDNEPNGWIAVHHDVRPQNIGYGELLSKSIAYATAIKAADPSALVLGPGDIAPADEGCNSGGVAGTCSNDSVGHGTPLGLYYLQQFAAQGHRLLDYYSMHYPGSCCFSTNGTLADTIAVIQRHQAWIAQAYPGTKLAYDEWNRGTGNGFSNSLATADGLGVFGAYGVDLASFWGLSDPSYPSAYAFRMFRNYDGAGGAFGSTSVAATTADATQLTVYAAQRATDNALTVLVVNNSSSALTSSVALNTMPTGPVAVYQYTAANAAAIVSQPSLPATNTVYPTFPAQSLTMLVVPSTAVTNAHVRRAHHLTTVRPIQRTTR